MSFAPTDLSGLAIWYDASGLSLGSLSSWTDLSGNAHHGTMTGSPNPSVIAAPGDLPGALPVVRFTASQGHVLITSGTGVTTNWTVAYVARMVGSTSGRVVGAYYSGGSINLLLGYWNGFEDSLYDNGFPGGVTITGPAYSTDWKLYSGDGATSAATRLFSNGTLVSSVTSSPNGFGGTLAISGTDTTSAETSDVQVAEFVQYSTKLSDGNRQLVEGYLRDKWLTSGDEVTVNVTVAL